MPSGNSHHSGSYMPMRSPHAAHSRNGSVITHRTSDLGASRESPLLYAGPDAANQGKSTRFLWTTTEAILSTRP